MPRLIDAEPSKFAQIGRNGLLQFIDEMNEKRARVGERKRYKPVENDQGELTCEFELVQHGQSAHTPSPHYLGPRLPEG